MYDDSFGKRFVRQFFLTLGIQIVFLLAAGMSLNFTDKVIYYDNIILIGCIAAALVNIILTLKSELKIWQKLILIFLMPTNITFYVLYRGLAVKLVPIFTDLFKKLERTGQ